MKKLIYLIVAIVALGLIVPGCISVVPPAGQSVADDKGKPGDNNGCTTIQSGDLLDSAGNVITAGYDEFGYNYQAHMFNGRYCDSDRVAGGDYCDVNLIMKWNDAWLSNKSCDDDLLLDRHFGYESYIGSGAWITNHMWGEYDGEDGKICKWEYFTKIVAVPADATLGDLVGYDEWGDPIYFWYAADGTEIGREIWGSFATIQSIYNDPCGGYHGVEYLSPAGPGFGKF